MMTSSSACYVTYGDVASGTVSLVVSGDIGRVS